MGENVPLEDMFFTEVRGIPPVFRSHNLRAFFSNFVEADKFLLFHYRHRKNRDSYVCFVGFLSPELRQEFRKTYGGRHWEKEDGDLLGEKCLVMEDCLGVEEMREDLPELKAPKDLMPKGNVGTPTWYFKSLIDSCSLPSKVIAKLKLQFPGKRRKYGNVTMNYGAPPTFYPSAEEGDKEEVEEWDRHESLHDDVSARRVLSGDPDNVPGTKERTFEDETEVTWEKGSSGLVFYTDASFWKDPESGDADDWDVDMSKYSGDAGDKDSEDYFAMRGFYRRSTSKSLPSEDSVFRKKIGSFEKYTKGFGRRLMEKQGWKDGEGLGTQKNKGISEALQNEGQINRSGIGYREETLPFFKSRGQKRKKGKSGALISTIYDNPSDTDPKESIYTRNPDNFLKYRKL